MVQELLSSNFFAYMANKQVSALDLRLWNKKQQQHIKHLMNEPRQKMSKLGPSGIPMWLSVSCEIKGILSDNMVLAIWVVSLGAFLKILVGK